MTKGEVVTTMEKQTHIFGLRPSHTTEIVNQIKAYLEEHPANYYDQKDSLLELIYHSYTEFNFVELPEFKAIVNTLDHRLLSLVETDEEADWYMNIVFYLCCEYAPELYWGHKGRCKACDGAVGRLRTEQNGIDEIVRKNTPLWESLKLTAFLQRGIFMLWYIFALSFLVCQGWYAWSYQ